MSEKVLTHKWQEQGLGEAPFHSVTMITLPGTAMLEAGNHTGYNQAMQEAHQQARVYGVTLATCYSCGMSLMNNVIIRDKNNKHFVVGLDCALKTDDSKLITQSQALERKRQKAIRERKAEVERDIIQAELKAQRERNGGLTDYEKQQAEREQAVQRERNRFGKINYWIIEVLRGSTGDFIESMIDALHHKEARDLSPRQLEIISEIYAKNKSRARKNSKPYQAAQEEFLNRLNGSVAA